MGSDEQLLFYLVVGVLVIVVGWLREVAMRGELLEKFALMAARIELLEHVVARMFNHEKSERFDELEAITRCDGNYYDTYDRVSVRKEAILEDWRQVEKAGGNDE